MLSRLLQRIFDADLPCLLDDYRKLSGTLYLRGWRS
jgi:hypothetical protein